MTTIAWDGKTLAADSLTSRGDTRYNYNNKIVQLKDGRYIGCAGSLESITLAINYLNFGGDKPKIEEGFACIIVSPILGVATEMYENLIELPCPDMAVQGSGWLVALSAMKAGADAKRAVGIAIELDVLSGGEVNFISVVGE